MSNLTITIDEQLLRAARVKAVQLGTSVNEVCRQAIATFALSDPNQATARAHARAQAFVSLSEQVRGVDGGPSGRIQKTPVPTETTAPSRRTRYQALAAEKPAAVPQRGAKR